MADLPETVKVAKVKLSLSDALQYATIPIAPGKDEIALLLASSWDFYVSGACYAYGDIWRKAYPKTDAALFAARYQSDDILDRAMAAWVQSTAVGIWRASESFYKPYPYPMVLVRPPQLVAYATVASVSFVHLTCYYLLQKVTKDKMNELLVKDHD